MTEKKILSLRISTCDVREGRLVNEKCYRDFGFSKTIPISIWPKAMHIRIENVNYTNGMGLLTWDIVALSKT